jgi:hypothetical protein
MSLTAAPSAARKASELERGTTVPRFFWCAEDVRQLGGESPLHNLMEVK